MKFPPYYTRTETIQKLLYDIDIIKEAATLHLIPQEASTEMLQRSILKSSLYSARIEGNPLTWSEVEHVTTTDSHELHALEVTNIYRAIEYVRNNMTVHLDNTMLRTLHTIILKDLSGDAGNFRMEESAIYNQAGIAVYLTPAPSTIQALLSGLYGYCNATLDPAPIQAAVAHIWFEKIHPYMDGNGRVGRVLTSFLLVRGGYEFGGTIPFEEYLDTHLDEYYRALSIDRPDVTAFVLFFLEALRAQTRESMKNLVQPPRIPYPGLLPRRREIVEILKDHQVVSFDFLARRFVKIPTRTLHYDLAQLVKAGYIQRLGVTRGSVYILGEKAK